MPSYFNCKNNGRYKLNTTNRNITLFLMEKISTRVINTFIYIICEESVVYPNDENIGQPQSTDLDNNYKYNITCDI